MSDRTDHVEWCKRQALEYLDAGDLRQAVTSMLSDMSKREDTDPPAFLKQIGMLELLKGDRESVRRFITGFN